jgi:hypothetical protein
VAAALAKKYGWAVAQAFGRTQPSHAQVAAGIALEAAHSDTRMTGGSAALAACLASTNVVGGVNMGGVLAIGGLSAASEVSRVVTGALDA